MDVHVLRSTHVYASAQRFWRPVTECEPHARSHVLGLRGVQANQETELLSPLQEPKDPTKDDKVATRRSSRRNAAAAPADDGPAPAGALLGGAKAAPAADQAVAVAANTALPPPPAPGDADAVPHMFETCAPRGSLPQKKIPAPRRQPMRAAKSMQPPVRLHACC